MNSLISNYYEKRGGEELNEADALTVMKALEKEIVNEVINEHAEEVAEREAAEHESLMRKERDERFRVAMKSFTRLYSNALGFGVMRGLKGSGAVLWAPDPAFHRLRDALGRRSPGRARPSSASAHERPAAARAAAPCPSASALRYAAAFLLLGAS